MLATFVLYKVEHGKTQVCTKNISGRILALCKTALQVRADKLFEEGGPILEADARESEINRNVLRLTKRPSGVAKFTKLM